MSSGKRPACWDATLAAGMPFASKNASWRHGMQLGNEFQGKKCARCRREIFSDPVYADGEWYHRVCEKQGKQELQRANEIAARFGFPPGQQATS